MSSVLRDEGFPFFLPHGVSFVLELFWQGAESAGANGKYIFKQNKQKNSTTIHYYKWRRQRRYNEFTLKSWQPAPSVCPGWLLTLRCQQTLHRSRKTDLWCRTRPGRLSWSPSGGPQTSGQRQGGSEGPKPVWEPWRKKKYICSPKY